jgi:glyoxylase I family protein
VDVKAVQHVALTVDDLDAALRFYALLGFDPLPRPDIGIPGAWLQAGDAQIHLLELDDPAPHAINHVALWVGDVDAAAEHLRSHGLRVDGPSPIGDSLQAFVKDPAGNIIELNEPTEPDQ